jgi:hypothetical protein
MWLRNITRSTIFIIIIIINNKSFFSHENMWLWNITRSTTFIMIWQNVSWVLILYYGMSEYREVLRATNPAGWNIKHCSVRSGLGSTRAGYAPLFQAVMDVLLHLVSHHKCISYTTYVKLANDHPHVPPRKKTLNPKP